MRHMLAFIVSALIHAIVFAVILWAVNTSAPENHPKTDWRTVYFDMGEMVMTQQEKPSALKPAQIPESLPYSTEKTTNELAKTPTQAKQSQTQLKLAQPSITKKKIPKSSTKAKQSKKKITKKQTKKQPKTTKKPKKAQRQKTNPSKQDVATKAKPQKPSKKTNKKAEKKISKAAANPSPASNLTLETLPLNDGSISTRSKPQQAAISSSQTSAAANNNYRQHLHSAIIRAASRAYPKKAKRMKKQGTVRIQFNLSHSGQISHIQVVGSSGEQLLDQAGKKAVSRLGKYKKPPVGFPKTVVVPIRFTLR